MKNILKRISTTLNKEANEIKENALKYRGKLVVIKYGGHTMKNPELAKEFAKDISIIQQIGIKPVIVHGGGPQIDDLLKKLRIKSTFVEGLRVTNLKTIEIVEMVLSGKINKNIVTNINFYGKKAIGLSGVDGDLIRAKKFNTKHLTKVNKNIKIKDLGYVGTPIKIKKEILLDLISHNYIPVIAPIGIGSKGTKYNINADTTAGAIASSLSARRLLMLTDVAGVIGNKNKLITELNIKDIKKLIKENIITGGMIPKVQTCTLAVKNGVKASVILDGRVKHALLLELFTTDGVGTLIKK